MGPQPGLAGEHGAGGRSPGFQSSLALMRCDKSLASLGHLTSKWNSSKCKCVQGSGLTLTLQAGLQLEVGSLSLTDEGDSGGHSCVALPALKGWGGGLCSYWDLSALGTLVLLRVQEWHGLGAWEQRAGVGAL